MALIGWGDPKLTITIPAQEEVLTDFPFLVNLSGNSGTGLLDCSFVFDELGSNSKKIAIEYSDTGEQCFVEVERWDTVNKSAQLWVKVPSVSASTPTVLSLYYDEAHADNTVAEDPYWSQTVLAMPMDGAEGSTTFSDLKGKTVSRYGGAKITGAQSKFGGGAAYFDGAGDYLTLPHSTDFNLNSGDHTVTFWIYIPSAMNTRIISKRATGTANAKTWSMSVTSAGVLSFNFWNSSGTYQVLNSSFVFGSWVHVAAVRYGDDHAVYINGNAGTVLTTTQRPSTNSYPLSIGVDLSFLATDNLLGYIDDIGIINGAAKYTSNFTPPTRSIFADAQGYVGDIGSHAARQVWGKDYLAVYHLSQDPSTTVKDSTVNAYNLTTSGTMTTAQLADGPTGKSLALDGSNDYLASAAGNLSALQTAMTAEVVAQFIDTEDDARLLTIGSEATGQFFVKRSGSSAYINVGVWGDDAQSGVAIDASGFKHYGHRLASGSLQAIGSGALDATTNAVTAQSLSAGVISIGKTASSYYQQTIRSIRISKTARSAAWLDAAYNSDFDQLAELKDIADGFVSPGVDSVFGVGFSTIVGYGSVVPFIDSISSSGYFVEQPTTGDCVVSCRIDEVAGTASTSVYAWGRVVPKSTRFSSLGISGTLASDGQVAPRRDVVQAKGYSTVVGAGDVIGDGPVISASGSATLVIVGTGHIACTLTRVSGSGTPATAGYGSISNSVPVVSASGYIKVHSTGRIAPQRHVVSGRGGVVFMPVSLQFKRDAPPTSTTPAPAATPLSFSR